MSSNANTTATMDSIKKKMQSMKLEKENAVDRAEQAEQKQKDLEEKLKASEEESNSLQKKIQQIEAELDAAQEQLGEANGKLEAKEKAATDVSLPFVSYFQVSTSRSIATDTKDMRYRSVESFAPRISEKLYHSTVTRTSIVSERQTTASQNGCPFLTEYFTFFLHCSYLSENDEMNSN
ncbi:unnamed protein product [Adineta ricciae]|uniref:Tropomyosin n=1 Tax=Adineta ricciae TaxID=249248 RepID=A0A816GQV9_ADIRI|nr:unnamed protein product [Adineta ricciae]